MNNEMDELFRKAGEDYPLNLGKPDWDAVAGKLQTDVGDLGPGFGVKAAASRKRRRFLWLLLLLPLGFYGITTISGRKTQPEEGDAGLQMAKTAQRAAHGSETATAAAQPTTRGSETATAAAQPTTGGSVTATTTAQPTTAQPTTAQPASGASGTAASKTGPAADGANKPGGNPVSASGTGRTKPEKTKPLSAPATATTRRSQSKRTTYAQRREDKPTAGRNNTGNIDASPLVEEPATPQPVAATEAKTGNAVVDSSGDLTGDNSTSLAELVMTAKANGTAEAPKKDTFAVTDKKQIKNDPKSLVHPSVKKERGFYAGITAGPDFSTVKFESLKNTGYSFGLVAGYRINHHFSVETGIAWDRKKYYSDGAYFDKSRTGIPPTVKVTYIDGYCEMFEIPVTVRYSFGSGRKGKWYAAAGLSSYLMKNENYLYGAVTNGNPWSRNVDYKNSGNNFLSIAQFSLGYEYGVDKRTSIRVEPYFKAPLRGVGIGSLPISSMGLTFGLIRSFR